MKHPNKKVEAIRREFAWALMVHKRLGATKSCFDFWLTNPVSVKQTVKLTEQSLLEALVDIRRGGKTVKVELTDL
jgi:hypothetical protein